MTYYTLHMDTHIQNKRIEERKEEGLKTTKTEVSVNFSGKFALFLTKKFGSMGMFYALVAWTFGWIVLAMFGVGYFKKDPYPYPFLLFLSNLVQLFSLPILAVGQQLLNKSSDKQAEQTFKDTEAILKLQDEIHRLIKINNKLTDEIHQRIITSSNQ